MLLNAELWNHAYPAIAALRSKARELVGSGRWYPRRDPRELDIFKSGWPNPSIKEWRQNGPPHLNKMFGEKADTLRPFAYADIPEFTDYQEYVLSTPDLNGRFVPERLSDSSFRMMFVNDFVLNIADRCEALGLPDTPEAVMEVYTLVEAAYLAPTLRIDVMVPLLLASFEDIEELEIGDNVVIKRISDALQLARAPRYDFSPVSGPLRSAATHAVFVHDIEYDNSTVMIHLFDKFDVSDALDKVDRVLRCLRVLSDINTGYADIYAIPSGWSYAWEHDLPALVHLETVRRYPEIMEDGGWNKPPKAYETDVIPSISKLYATLDGSNKRLAIAARRLDVSRLRRDPEDQVLDACIGLEALLGNEQSEITHRLAQRAAVLLRREINPTIVYQTVRDIYSCRSKIAHGADSAKKMVIRYGDESFWASDLAVYLLAKVVRAIAFDQSSGTPESLDSAILGYISNGESQG